MPRISERQLLLSEIDIAVKNMVLFEFGDDDEIDELLELKALLMDSRFLNMRQFVRKNKSMNEMLWFYGEREFKQIVRMSKDSFLKLLNLIKDDEVFGKEIQRHRQCPIWIQLMVVLQRLGCDGNGISVGRCA